MDEEKALSVVKEGLKIGKRFKVTYDTGCTRVVRLFISSSDSICAFNKGSSRYGYLLPVHWVTNIEVIPERVKTDPKSVFTKHAIKLHRILKESGLWSNIVKHLEYADFDFDKFKEIDSESLAYAILYWRVKKMAFREHKYSDATQRILAEYKQHKEDKKDYNSERCRGRSYDVSMSYKLCKDGIERAWYSEEFRGCLNGHYFIVIDDYHAIHTEDD